MSASKLPDHAKGDSMTDHPDTDLTDPHGEAEALRLENEMLRRENGRLRAERDYDRSQSAHKSTVIDRLNARAEAAEAALAASRAPDPVVNAGSCQHGDLISRAAAVEVAASIADRQCHDNMPHEAYMAYHSGAMDVLDAIRALPAAKAYSGQQGDTLARIAAHPAAEEIAKEVTAILVKHITAAPVAEAQPTIGGAELDVLAAQAMTPHTVAAHQVAAALHRQTVDPLQSYVTIEQCLEYGQRIRDAALRAQPDWQEMAERLGDAMKPCLNFIENTESEFGIALECGNKARAVLSDLAKMKGATK